MAAPFVQGQLSKEHLSVEIETKCHHCGEGLHIKLDSEMHATLREEKAAPLVFMPDVDWDQFAARTIIDAY